MSSFDAVYLPNFATGGERLPSLCFDQYNSNQESNASFLDYPAVDTYISLYKNLVIVRLSPKLLNITVIVV